MTQKAKKEIMITVALIPFLLFFVARAFLEVKQKKGPPRAPAAVSGKSSAIPAGKAMKKADYAQIEKTEDTLAELEEKARKMKLKRDPFSFGQPAQGEEILSSDLHLYGIIWDEEEPLAVINEATVKTGDKIGNSTVVKIGQDFVILNDGTKEYKLNLNLE